MSIEVVCHYENLIMIDFTLPFKHFQKKSRYVPYLYGAHPKDRDNCREVAEHCHIFIIYICHIIEEIWINILLLSANSIDIIYSVKPSSYRGVR